MKDDARWPLPAIALLVAGFMQMSGDLFQVAPLKGIGAAWMFSPAPKVFSSVKGLETYSTQTFLEWNDKQGVSHSIEFTPEIYAKLAGPYNRRNIFGAALAYGPVFAEDERLKPLLRSVVAYALTNDAPLLVELGVDVETVVWPIVLRYVPAEGTEMGDLPRSLEIPLP
ncbi:MAG: hypothetical protein COA70_08440 [Planctomycetota bacterium]|nr:MAG: hypothetical protein COA70_08440 [Planctomycetota bacterium]